MRKILALFVCLVLLAAALPAQAVGITEIMCVANCNEYVSLRESPSTSSKRLKTVHLGELVSNCESAENGFVRCEWDGKTGYILFQYLAPTTFSAGEGILKNQMVVNCQEWVSLRELPDTSSARLIKVPLGAIVTQCVTYMGNFVFCEYKGKKGYISTKYLRDADYSQAAPAPLVTKEYPALPSVMEVYNCKEWVSLRREPSSASLQLAKVPLGGLVSSCQQVNDQFVSCQYNGTPGYVAIQYLKAYEPATPEPAPVPFEGLPLLPDYDDYMEAGHGVLEYTFMGYTVAVRRDFQSEDTEVIRVVCYSAAHTPLWSAEETTWDSAEVQSTDAFIAGSADRPLVVLFAEGKGFTAYEVGPWKSLQWQNTTAPARALSGSIQTAVFRDGTAYVIGYYDHAPLCLSPQGETLWMGETSTMDLYWPFNLDALEDGVEVYFCTFFDDDAPVYAVRYGEDGKIQMIRSLTQSSLENLI